MPEKADISFFVELESRVWQALVDGDDEADERLLDDGFLGVYPSGFATRKEHAGQLLDGPTVGEFAIREPRLIPLSPTSVLLAYRADFTRRSRRSVGPTQSMYVSSIWSERAGRWTSRFSQDSPADAPAGGAMP